MNWRYITAVLDSGADGDLSDYLAEIISTDCEFLSAGKISENTMQVQQDADYELAWDWVKEKIELGDGTAPWHIECINDRLVNFKAIDWSPRYIWKKGEVYDSVGDKVAVNPYTVWPAVCRDVTYPIRGAEIGSPFEDRRDFLIDEVEVGERSGLTVKMHGFDEGEFISGVAEYEQWLSDREAEEAAKGSGGGGKQRWKWKDMSDEEKKWYLGRKEERKTKKKKRGLK